jgi:hypothetical protein
VSRTISSASELYVRHTEGLRSSPFCFPGIRTWDTFAKTHAIRTKRTYCSPDSTFSSVAAELHSAVDSLDRLTGLTAQRISESAAIADRRSSQVPCSNFRDRALTYRCVPSPVRPAGTCLGLGLRPGGHCILVFAALSHRILSQ